MSEASRSQVAITLTEEESEEVKRHTGVGLNEFKIDAEEDRGGDESSDSRQNDWAVKT
jgi:hypothetical protein